MFDFRCDSIVCLMTQIQNRASAYSILPLVLAYLNESGRTLFLSVHSKNPSEFAERVCGQHERTT